MPSQRVIRQEAKTDTDSDFDEIIETETDNDLSRILNMGLINNPKQLEIDEGLLEKMEEYIEFESKLHEKRTDIANIKYGPFFIDDELFEDDDEYDESIFEFELSRGEDVLFSIKIKVYSANCDDMFFYMDLRDFKRVAYKCGEKAVIFLEEYGYIDFCLWIIHTFKNFEYDLEKKKIKVVLQ